MSWGDEEDSPRERGEVEGARREQWAVDKERVVCSAELLGERLSRHRRAVIVPGKMG
jgi:hypothetical protein